MEDGDYINFNAFITGDGYNIGFCNCGGKILPDNPDDEFY